ncbi:MAG: hypothetical protein KA152_18470 [Verrucomicrobiales bacterium]|nr:hypothetical protein [Verrucomicrobiales bacterium]
MPALISELFTFFFRQHPSEIWTRVRERDVPWIVQLALYGFCGVLATVVAVTQVCDSFKDHHSCL